jgi:hypothetical protein
MRTPDPPRRGGPSLNGSGANRIRAPHHFLDTASPTPCRALPSSRERSRGAPMAVTTTRADQYRQLARDFHLMARNLAPGEERSALLKMAEQWDRLSDEQEQAKHLRKNE